MEDERPQLREIVKELTEERYRLQKELALAQAARDQCLRFLYALIPREPFTFSEKELREANQNCVTLQAILQPQRRGKAE
jgi:hypothetical protein